MMPYFVSAINIECSYDVNTCSVLGGIKFTATDRTITSAGGTQPVGKSKDDITTIKFYGIPINYFPLGITNVFPNVQKVYVQSANLMEITKNDLKDLPNLTEIYLGGNNIYMLGSDLFDYTPNVNTIGCIGCKITYIHPNTFDSLKNLSQLWLSSNQCIDETTQSGLPISTIIADCKTKCSNQEFIDIYTAMSNLDSQFQSSNFVEFNKNFEAFEAQYKNSPQLNNPLLKSKYDALKANYATTPKCTNCCQINEIAASVGAQIQNLQSQFTNSFTSFASNVCTKSDIAGVNSNIQSVSSSMASFSSAINQKLDTITAQLNTLPGYLANITITIKNLEKKLNDRLEWIEYRLKKVEKKASCSRHRRHWK